METNWSDILVSPVVLLRDIGPSAAAFDVDVAVVDCAPSKTLLLSLDAADDDVVCCWGVLKADACLWLLLLLLEFDKEENLWNTMNLKERYTRGYNS